MNFSDTQPATPWIAFVGTRRLAMGAPLEVAQAVKTHLDTSSATQELAIGIFDACSSAPVEIDTRGSLAEVLARISARISSPPRAPGRPKLGVVAREVTLLPRHWDWLAAQPGGASVTLRKLVEQAQREQRPQDERRQARDAAYRFMHAMAGNEAGFEEASRALFAGDVPRLQACMASWPNDVREHTLSLVGAAYSAHPVLKHD